LMDRAGVRVNMQKQKTAQGTDLNIIIEEIVAEGARKPGNPINQSLREVQGTSLIRR